MRYTDLLNNPIVQSSKTCLEDIEMKENRIINRFAKIEINKFNKKHIKLDLFYVTDKTIYFQIKK
jgi:hypothetical protein